MTSGYRYGQYDGGPDPLEPPYDVRGAVDELGEQVLDGSDPASALRDLLRRGMSGHRGPRRPAAPGAGTAARDPRPRPARRHAGAGARAAGHRHRAGAGRAVPRPVRRGPAARVRAGRAARPTRRRRSGSSPTTTGGRPPPRQTFEELKDLLRREVLDSQFRGMKQALAEPDPEAMQRVKDMMADLNGMLEADARGEHTQQDFDDFMEQLRRHVPRLARQPGGARRLAGPADVGGAAAAGLAHRRAARRAGRPDGPGARGHGPGRGDGPAGRRAAGRAGRTWTATAGPQARMTGSEPLGLSDATTALAELADLDELEDALRQDYPGARLDDIDEEAVRRALGRQAVDDMEALRQIERELERQGYLQRTDGKLELTPKAVRRLGQTALRQVFAELPEGGTGDHDQHDAGQAGELTGSTRPWRFGDEQPIDAAATVRNALLHQAARHRPSARQGRAGAPGSGCRCATSRSPRPSGARPPRSACWSTCPTRWCCAAPGARPSRPRWRCTRWCGPSTRRTRSRSSASRTTPGNCARPSWPA